MRSFAGRAVHIASLIPTVAPLAGELWAALASTLAGAFSAIDDDKEGLAAFDEFNSWLNGQFGRRALVRRAHGLRGAPGVRAPDGKICLRRAVESS